MATELENLDPSFCCLDTEIGFRAVLLFRGVVLICIAVTEH